MIKKHLKTMIIASLVILLPIVAGVVLWDQLPEQIPVHWDISGQVDGWASKPFAILGLPLIMLALQWVCVIATGADPKKKNMSDKMLQLVLWIIPVLQIVLSCVIYITALGKNMPVEMILPLLLGLLFVIIGNYLPKCKQSYTVGLKLPWTLNSEENWNKTHRLAGKIWVVGGFVIMISSIAGGWWLFVAAALVMVLAPSIYSYLLYRKGI